MEDFSEVDSIEKGVKERCVLVRVRALPGENVSEFEKIEGPMITYIPFCLQCYEDKKMSGKMKITIDDDVLESAVADYEIGYGCSACIERYSTENKIN